MLVWFRYVRTHEPPITGYRGRSGRYRQKQEDTYVTAPLAACAEPLPLARLQKHVARAEIFHVFFLSFFRSKSIHGDATTVTSSYPQCRVASFLYGEASGDEN